MAAATTHTPLTRPTARTTPRAEVPDSAPDAGAMVELHFAVDTASVDAIQRAAYRFSDRFSSELIPGEANHRCLLTPVEDVDVAAEVADFRTEVLDQTLRERIRAETEPIRTMILAQAFSKTGVVDPQDLT
jgi:His-Xaa-Ser system protein HxsD